MANARKLFSTIMVSTSLFVLGTLMTTACIVSAPSDEKGEHLGSTSEALDIATCPGSGDSAISGTGHGTSKTVSYESENKADCDAYACPFTTLFTAAWTDAENKALADCGTKSYQHKCPVGCGMTVTTTTACHGLMKVPRKDTKSECIQNSAGRWQTDCTSQADVTAQGTFHVECTPFDTGVGEDTGAGEDTGVGSDTGTSSDTGIHWFDPEYKRRLLEEQPWW